MSVASCTAMVEKAAVTDKNTPLLSVRDLLVRFKLRDGLAAALSSGPSYLKAVDEVSFDVGRGEVLGLVGESGSGKTTIGKAILRLYQPQSGSIVVNGVDITRMGDRARAGSPLTPSYYALSLLFHTTVPGWKIVRVDPWDASDSSVPTWGIEGHSSNDTPEKELAAFEGPDGQTTVMGLDTHGRDLNVASSDPWVPYSIGGLTPNTNFNLVVWNATGDGTNSVVGTVPANSDGVVRFSVPLQAAFSLTTLPVS